MKDNVLSVNIPSLFFSFFMWSHQSPPATIQPQNGSWNLKRQEALFIKVYASFNQSLHPLLHRETSWMLFCKGVKVIFFCFTWIDFESIMHKSMHCSILTIMRPLHIITWTLLQKRIWKTIMLYACTMQVCICACIWVSYEGFLHETSLSSALLLPQCLWRVCVRMWLTQPWHICKASCISICSKLLLSEFHMTWPGSSTVLHCNTWIQQYPVSPPPHPLCWSRQTHSFFLTALQLLLTGGSERKAGKALSKFGWTLVKLNWFVSRLHNTGSVFCILIIRHKKETWKRLNEALVINI